MHLSVGLLLLVFVPFCISRTLNDHPPPVDGVQVPVDGVGDEGTLKMVNGPVYKVDDDIHKTVDLDDPMVDEMVDAKGPIKVEELWNMPYSKRKHP